MVEVQQTFYQPPRLKTLERWRKQVPPEFEFTIKAWQLITHEASSPTYRRLREKLSETQRRETGSFRVNSTVMAAWERTLESARALQSQMILFQCPARFRPSEENKGNMRSFFREIARSLAIPKGQTKPALLWEPRGEWKDGEIRELSRELGLIHAVDPFQQNPTSKGLGYFRLHGKSGYRYTYTDGDLDALLERTRSFRPCYVLFNNLSMAEDAQRFQEIARRSLGSP